MENIVDDPEAAKRYELYRRRRLCPCAALIAQTVIHRSGRDPSDQFRD